MTPVRAMLPVSLVGSAPLGHAGLERCPGEVLGPQVRRREPVIAVLGGPVELFAVVLVVNGILRLIARGIDVREGVAHNELAFWRQV
jgi:hypothetical protein